MEPLTLYWWLDLNEVFSLAWHTNFEWMVICFITVFLHSSLYLKHYLIAPDKCQTILPSLEIWQMYVKGQLSYLLDAHVWIFFFITPLSAFVYNFNQIGQVIKYAIISSLIPFLWMKICEVLETGYVFLYSNIIRNQIIIKWKVIAKFKVFKLLFGHLYL